MFVDAIKTDIHPSTWAVCGIKRNGEITEILHRGTAFAVDTHGHLVTCWHVTYMDEACTIECDEFMVVQPELNIAGRFRALLVAKERDRDIAVLKIADEAGVRTHPVHFTDQPVPFGRSACAFGHPLTHTDPANNAIRFFTRAAAGVVSMPFTAPRFPGTRPIQLYELDFFTHGGASGGPVFPRSGDVFAFVSGSLMLPGPDGAQTRSNLSVAISAHEAIEFLNGQNIKLHIRRGPRR